MFIFLYVSLYMNIYLYLFNYLSIHLFTFIFIYLSSCIFLYDFIIKSVIFIFICLQEHLQLFLYDITVNACIFSKIRSLFIYKYMWPFNHKKRQLPEYRSCLNIWMKCCIHYRFWWYGKVHAIDTRIHEKNNNWKRIDKNQQESWTGSPVRRSDHAKQILPSHSLPSVQYTK